MRNDKIHYPRDKRKSRQNDGEYAPERYGSFSRYLSGRSVNEKIEKFLFIIEISDVNGYKDVFISNVIMFCGNV